MFVNKCRVGRESALTSSEWVCVCVALRYGDFIWFYLLLWFTGKHSPRSLRATGLREVSWTAAAPRLRLHVRNDHWHCRAEGVSHSHTHTHTKIHAHLMPKKLSQVSTKSKMSATSSKLLFLLSSASLFPSLSLSVSCTPAAHSW